MADARDRYAQVLVRIWDDPDWTCLSPRAQWFYMLLISQAGLNRAGIINLTVNWWSTLSAGGSAQQVNSAITELEQTGYVVVDRVTEELLVRSYIRNSGIAKQPNVLKRALRESREVHSRQLRVVIARELRRINSEIAAETADDLDPDPTPSPVKAKRNPSLNPSTNGSRAPRPDKADSRRSTGVPEGFAEPLAEPFGEPLAEGFAEPRGKGLGLGSSSRLDINSSSEPSSSDDASRRPDVDHLCSLLYDRLTANGSKASINKQWRDSARLLLDRDHRPLDEALKLINWCQNHYFWHATIMSMPTFRKQYDKLRLQAQQETGRHLKAVSGGYQPYQAPADDAAYLKPIQ